MDLLEVKSLCSFRLSRTYVNGFLFCFLRNGGSLCALVVFLLIGIETIHAESRNLQQAITIAQKKARTMSRTLNTTNLGSSEVYVFNFKDDKGFVMVSGDDRLPDILAYGEDGQYSSSNPATYNFFYMFSCFVSSLNKGNYFAKKHIPEIKEIRSRKYNAIKPLLGNLHWTYGSPFTNKYPKQDFTSNDCRPYEIAKIMRYYQYPQTLLKDIPGYSTESHGLKIDSIKSGVQYDWANMKDDYRKAYSKAEAEAISTLIYHIAVANKKGSGSEAENFWGPNLAEYWGYDKDLVQFLSTSSYTKETLFSIIQNELQNKRPCFAGYEGTIDGVDTDGLFHVNRERGSFYADLTVAAPEFITIGITPDNGIKDEHIVTDKPFYVSKANEIKIKKYKRDSATDTFSGSVEFWYDNYETVMSDSLLVAVAALDKDGNITPISKGQQFTPGVEWRQWHDFEYSFPNGRFLLVPIISKDKGKTWQMPPCAEDWWMVEATDKYFQIVYHEDAYTGGVVIDGIRYQLGNNEATVLRDDYKGDVVIPKTIKYSNKTYTVTAIGNEAFSGCACLEGITIPSSVTSIGNAAFKNCEHIKNAKLPSGLQTLGTECFMYCAELEQMEIPSGITEIPEWAFYGCTGLQKIDIPQSVTKLGKMCFGNCGFTSIELPNSITTIEENAFSGSSIESIVIPSNVSRIENFTFFVCNKLRHIELPEKTSYIGQWALDFDTDYTEVVCRAKELPTLGYTPFAGWDKANKGVLYVPAESLEKYKNADEWKDFGTILPIDPTGISNVSKDDIKIMNIDNTLVVSGAKNGTIVRVYSVDGKLLEKKVVENNSVSVVASAPLVIVKVGEQSFKVALKIQK